MNIMEDIFSFIMNRFFGFQDEPACYICSYFSTIGKGIERVFEHIDYIVRQKYYEHVSHSYWRIFKNQCDDMINYISDAFPTVFIYLMTMFIIYKIISRKMGNLSPVQFKRIRNDMLRRRKLVSENQHGPLLMMGTREIVEAGYFTIDGVTYKCCLVESLEEHCNNTFVTNTYSESIPKIIFGGSNHSLPNLMNIVENEGQYSHSGFSGSQEFGEADVLNEAIPMNRMRRESVCAEAYDPDKDVGLQGYELHSKNQAQKDFLLERVGKIFPFCLLDNDQLELVLGAMFQRKVSKGEVIISEGDRGDFFYVIERGSFVVSVSRGNEEKILKVYHDSGSFGELALMYNTRRAATVSAAGGGIVWCLDRLTFKSVVARTAHQRRIMNESLLRHLPLLSHLPAGDILSLSDALVRRTYDDGELIIQQGGVPDGMYFIRKGSVRVCILGEFEEEEELKILTVGDYFGERALITRGKREASVYAKGSVELEYKKNLQSGRSSIMLLALKLESMLRP